MTKVSIVDERADTTTFARKLRQNRRLIVEKLIAGPSAPRINRYSEPDTIFRSRVEEEVELLSRYFDGDIDAGAFYVGLRISELVHIEKSAQDNQLACKSSIETDEQLILSGLGSLTAEEQEAFEHAFRAVTKGLTTPPQKHLKTLFIGDCYMSEIISFAIGPLNEMGFSVDPFPVNPRNVSQLRKTLSELPDKSFDAVFFSPFSHSRTPEIGALLESVRSGFMSTARVDSLVDAAIDQAREILDYLLKTIECPIFVHNTALIPRSTNRFKITLKQLLMSRTTRHAAARLNRWVAEYIATENAKTYRHAFLVDECKMVEEHGSASLGIYLNTSRFQHATGLSRQAARQYQRITAAIAKLVGKKLVICDLDNTLWDGVIGEGGVAHFHDRQAILKSLKDHCGIVLSIASKNEPSNVHFDGGTLGLTDFVAPQISWGQKSAAVEKIRKTLNLQTKHMVFIDDRADERAIVQEAFPDILVLDPCDPETWLQCSLWAEMAHGSSDVDRTRMYQEQAIRDAALGLDAAQEQGADLEVLKKLDLRITLHAAKKSELKRVAELINRTNQWNLCGSRTTYEQVRQWSDSDEALVLVGSAADRFGDMGVVCVAVVTLTPDAAQVPVFVLSCRVFGYGVETAMLTEIARRAQIGTQRALLRGSYRATAQNQPCRNMYADHGFTQDGPAFTWSGVPDLPAIPWATVVTGSD